MNIAFQLNIVEIPDIFGMYREGGVGWGATKGCAEI